MANAYFEDEHGEILEFDSIEEMCVACGRDDVRVNGQEVIDGIGVAERAADGSVICDECWYPRWFRDLFRERESTDG